MTVQSDSASSHRAVTIEERALLEDLVNRFVHAQVRQDWHEIEELLLDDYHYILRLPDGSEITSFASRADMIAKIDTAKAEQRGHVSFWTNPIYSLRGEAGTITHQVLGIVSVPDGQIHATSFGGAFCDTQVVQTAAGWRIARQLFMPVLRFPAQTDVSQGMPAAVSRDALS